MSKVDERIADLKRRLKLYRDAEDHILLAQSYSIAGRSVSRANLTEIRNAIKEMEAELSSLENRGTSRRRVLRVCPLDQ